MALFSRHQTRTRRLRSVAVATSLVILAAACSSSRTSVATIRADVGNGRPLWDIGSDFRVAPNQANPSPDRLGHPAVWSYLFNTTSQHNPATYRKLPAFSTTKFGMAGLESWWGPNVSLPDDQLPTVGVNATGHEVDPFNIHWPPGAVLVHPWPGQPVIVGWRSPVSGIVFVTGGVALAQQPNCGNGIAWSFDLGAIILKQKTIQQLQSEHWSLRVHVTSGQSLYLVVDPQADIRCDSTLVQLTITRGNQSVTGATVTPATTQLPPVTVPSSPATDVAAAKACRAMATMLDTWDSDFSGRINPHADPNDLLTKLQPLLAAKPQWATLAADLAATAAAATKLSNIDQLMTLVQESGPMFAAGAKAADECDKIPPTAKAAGWYRGHKRGAWPRTGFPGPGVQSDPGRHLPDGC